MARPKTEISPLRAERVKIIIEREKLNQKEFGEKIHLSQHAVSHIVRLQTALTEETARNIIKAFPEYRIAWLLGYSDIMLKTETKHLIEDLPSAQPEKAQLSGESSTFDAPTGIIDRTTNAPTDCISRQTAIKNYQRVCREIACNDCPFLMRVTDTLTDCRLERLLPCAQPERLTDDDFETVRIHLSAYKEQLCNQHRWKEAEEYQRIIDRFMSFASAQPEIIACGDCTHYICHDRRCGYWNHGVKPLMWCSQAERKENR